MTRLASPGQRIFPSFQHSAGITPPVVELTVPWVLMYQGEEIYQGLFSEILSDFPITKIPAPTFIIYISIFIQSPLGRQPEIIRAGFPYLTRAVHAATEWGAIGILERLVMKNGTVGKGGSNGFSNHVFRLMEFSKKVKSNYSFCKFDPKLLRATGSIHLHLQEQKYSVHKSHLKL